MTTCPHCGLEYDEPECPICAPLKRALEGSRRNRRDYALRKMTERDYSFVEQSQPREQE